MLMLVIMITILGLLVGSFLNVVILRLHAKKQFVKGRSECPNCKHKLVWAELIPVFSWLAQRGKCRNCKKPISVQYPLVEVATAVLFVISYMQFNFATAADIVIFVTWSVAKYKTISWLLPFTGIMLV